ncbi:hypothetical protein [Paludisphaera borealis]|uniref:hypothetical protein n=1 Tax=Paludisphaera borealis TaxID=1387353 RepID=UPI000970C33D|nr:hypothetical protein [Paludisphaera borealis]
MAVLAVGAKRVDEALAVPMFYPKGLAGEQVGGWFRFGGRFHPVGLIATTRKIGQAVAWSSCSPLAVVIHTYDG